MAVDPVFRAPLATQELLHLLQGPLERKEKIRLLDVGGGSGVHARFFVQEGIDVEVLDLDPDYEGIAHTEDLFKFETEEPYDVVWTSHCLEHVRNTGIFLDRLIELTKPDGYLAIIVPPLSSDMRRSHLTLWNAGLVLINLVAAGLDCSEAHVATMDYNVCVIVKKKFRAETTTKKEAFPAVEWNGKFFAGDIKFLNWTCQDKNAFSKEVIKEEWTSKVASTAHFQNRSEDTGTFFWKENEKGRRKHFYFCPILNDVLISN